MKPGSVFWDIGCDVGRAMICVALSDCGFSKICGVEYLEGLYNLCCSVVEKFKKVTGSENSTEFNLIHCDITKIDWSDADLIYSSSICFPEPLIQNISELGAKLEKGTKILTLKNFPHQN